MKAYRLLRNNKEEGPFTAEEIIQKNLKPYDLIWVDGRSAAWRYPGEMPEFKMYVPLPADETKTAQTNKQAAIAINESIIQPSIKQPKPRYKVSAAWNKIQTVTTPVYANLIAEPEKNAAQKKPVLQAKSLSWEEAWQDWEKEKIVAPVAETTKVNAVNLQQKNISKKNYNAVLETKYAEPLDSLKDKYIENILQQKQKTKRNFSFGKAAEFIIPSFALIIIFSVGYWFLHHTNQTANVLNNVLLQKQQPAKIENATNTIPLNTNNDAVNNTAQVANEPQNIASSNAPVVTDQAKDRKTNYVHAAKLTLPKQQNKFPATEIDLSKQSSQKKTDGTSRQFAKDEVRNSQSSSNNGDINNADERAVRRRTNADVTANQSTPKKETAVIKTDNTKSVDRYVNAPQYIAMTDGSADFKIQNISDVDLDLVVVNVQYYDASGRFNKGETLYVHNLKAGKNVIVKTPKDTSSQYATSKVSLVSSDANNVYIVSDN